MRCRISVFLAALMVAAALTLMSTAAQAQPERKGVSYKVLAAFPSDVPGIGKLVLVELRLEPGGYMKNVTLPATGLVTAIQGTLTVVSGGKTVIHGAGSTWVSPKGTKVSIYNNGSEPHVHHIWRLVPSK
ncbi:MAG: cupin domain-containing protein [Nitrospinota bacterium]